MNPITALRGKWAIEPESLARALSPLHHVSEATPPALVIHGQADRVVDIGQSRAFRDRMEEANRPCRLLEWPGVDHAFSVFGYGPDESARRAVVEIGAFLEQLGWLPADAGAEKPAED